MSPDTHRHCCVAVGGPGMEPPGEGSVPWSPAPAHTPRGAHRKLLHLLLLQRPPVTSVAARRFSSSRLHVSPSPLPFPLLPHHTISLRPSLPSRSWTAAPSSHPPPSPRLAVQVRSSLKDANHSRKQDELCFQLVGYAAVQCFYLVLDLKCWDCYLPLPEANSTIATTP